MSIYNDQPGSYPWMDMSRYSASDPDDAVPVLHLQSLRAILHEPTLTPLSQEIWAAAVDGAIRPAQDDNVDMAADEPHGRDSQTDPALPHWPGTGGWPGDQHDFWALDGEPPDTAEQWPHVGTSGHTGQPDPNGPHEPGTHDGLGSW